MNTANIEIKNITNADRSAVLDMMEQLYYSPAVLTDTPRRVLQKCLDDAIRGLPQIEGYVLKADGEYAGYSLVAKGYTTEFGGICIQIEDLFVLPAHRGKSIGPRFYGLSKTSTEAKPLFCVWKSSRQTQTRSRCTKNAGLTSFRTRK